MLIRFWCMLARAAFGAQGRRALRPQVRHLLRIGLQPHRRVRARCLRSDGSVRCALKAVCITCVQHIAGVPLHPLMELCRGSDRPPSSPLAPEPKPQVGRNGRLPTRRVLSIWCNMATPAGIFALSRRGHEAHCLLYEEMWQQQHMESNACPPATPPPQPRQ